jgi:proteasome lid subunit RPN8/RPN11
MTINIPRQLVNQLLHHAQQNEGREICGFISGRDDKPVGVYPVINIAATPECRFTMDPADQINALRKMRESGEELFAIYHSHPASPASPSTIDVEEAGYPEALYLIISLDTKGVLEMRGYRIKEKKVTEIGLTI